jgi:general secretion pathway protein B
MSFILDALKKSESERQRQAIPGLMDSRPLPARPRFPPWAVALIALLAINLVVLAVMLTRSHAHGDQADRSPSLIAPAPTAPAAAILPAPAVPPATAAQTPRAPPAAATARDHFSPMDPTPADQAPVYAPEIPADQGSGASAGEQHHISAGRAASGGVSHHTARLPDPVLAQEDDRASDEVLPSINEINLNGSQALPELHLDVHVFATNPAERFVYINMRKYHEGATLAEGPVLERIRRDGVVLNYNGLRFVLPRQQ